MRTSHKPGEKVRRAYSATTIVLAPDAIDLVLLGTKISNTMHMLNNTFSVFAEKNFVLEKLFTNNHLIHKPALPSAGWSIFKISFSSHGNTFVSL